MTEVAALSAEQIKNEVFAQLDQYKDRSVLEQFAIFMGKAQILEFGLKRLLARKFNVPLEEMELWTLGKTKSELRQEGVQNFV